MLSFNNEMGTLKNPFHWLDSSEQKLLMISKSYFPPNYGRVLEGTVTVSHLSEALLQFWQANNYKALVFL